MNQLRKFWEEERKRIFDPSSHFVGRVMARLNERAETEAGVWEAIPVMGRQFLALVLVLMLCFAALELFVPIVPERGIVGAFLESQQGPVESLLLGDPDAGAEQFMEELIALGDEP